MIRLLAVALLVACGSARSGDRVGAPTGTPAGHGSARGTPAGTGRGSSAAADGPPTDQECETLLAHALTIEMAERPPDQQLTEPELARIRAKLRERDLPACRVLSRETYGCMLAAATSAERNGCK